MYDEKFVSVTILCIEFVECEFCATSIILKWKKKLSNFHGNNRISLVSWKNNVTLTIISILNSKQYMVILQH